MMFYQHKNMKILFEAEEESSKIRKSFEID